MYMRLSISAQSLAFGATGTGVDFDHGTELVFFLAQHFLELKLFHGLGRFFVVAVQFFLAHVAGLVELIEYFQVVHDLW